MNKTFELPKKVEFMLQILWHHGAEAFLVGGYVRDMLMKREVHDYDITTSALPNMMIPWFQEARCHVILTGLKHGTITVIYQDEPFEITTYRSESGYLNHRSPEDVQFTKRIEEDLLRRDFTMNAIAYDPRHGIVDPYHGVEDINHACIRCVGEPIKRFEEDALRILRALRFRCTLNFTIEYNTWIAIQSLAHDLHYVSGERKRDELNRILMSNNEDTLQFLYDANVINELFEGYDELYNYQQMTPWHIFDVFRHSDTALNHTKHLPLTSKLAIIFHDIGKPACETFDDMGIAHYKGHAKVSVEKANVYLKKLHYDSSTIQRVLALIQYHDYYVTPRRNVLRRYVSKFNHDVDFALQALDVQIADNYAKNPERSLALIENVRQCKHMIQEMSEEEDFMTLKDLCINGHDVMKLGYKGKQVGVILHLFYEQVLDDPSRNTQAYFKSFLSDEEATLGIEQHI